MLRVFGTDLQVVLSDTGRLRVSVREQGSLEFLPGQILRARVERDSGWIDLRLDVLFGRHDEPPFGRARLILPFPPHEETGRKLDELCHRLIGLHSLEELHSLEDTGVVAGRDGAERQSLQRKPDERPRPRSAPGLAHQGGPEPSLPESLHEPSRAEHLPEPSRPEASHPGSSRPEPAWLQLERCGMPDESDPEWIRLRVPSETMTLLPQR